MKKLITILIAGLVLVGLYGCGGEGADGENNGGEQTANVDGFFYENDDYGFSLVFPEDWGDQVAEQRINHPAGVLIDKSLRFETRENPDWFFLVDVVFKGDRVELEASEGFDHDYLGQNQEFAFYVDASKSGKTSKIRESFKAY